MSQPVAHGGATAPGEKPQQALTIGLASDPACENHVPPGPHPERPERLRAARLAVAKSGVAVTPIGARDASEEELARVHDARYVEELGRLAGRQGYLDEDTYLAPGSVAAARRAAGSALAVVDAMLDKEITRALALVRPPGHHARPARAMGFCLLNNIAVAAAHARSRGVDRVLVLDWDVHHGNGTQEMFLADPHVLYVSLHQWPFYPGTGAATETGQGEGRGYTVNVPLSAGAGHDDYAGAFDRVIMPAVEAFAPELVLVSAGFDAHKSDPLASMRLEAASYAMMTRYLVNQATRSAQGRIALLLEGGYDLDALEASVAASLEALAIPQAARPEARPPSPRFEPEIERARKSAAEQWAGCR
jgi:acetoin utilization deacetylase AcuC-like enzyme